MLKFRLENGEVVESPAQSYTVEVWYNGQWNIRKVFSPDRWEDVLAFKAQIKDEDVRVQQWF